MEIRKSREFRRLIASVQAGEPHRILGPHRTLRAYERAAKEFFPDADIAMRDEHGRLAYDSSVRGMSTGLVYRPAPAHQSCGGALVPEGPYRS